MAAILPFLEQDSPREDASGARADDQLSHYGKGPAKQDPTLALVETNHASLTRFVWNRDLLEDFLRTCKYWVEIDRHKGFVFRLDKGIPKLVRPWKMLNADAIDTLRFFGDGNAKMKCPTWDLPAGPPAVGGSCPGASAAQTVLPPAARKALLAPGEKELRMPAPGGDRVTFREAYTICSACYAGEGNFDWGEIQAAAVLRYWWTKELLRTPEGHREWVEVMTQAVLDQNIPVAEDCYSDEQVKPIRIHSSGDFFSPRYAEAWMDVANAVGAKDPQIKFWCPTRTWASPGAGGKSAFDWPAILGRLKRPNLVVRASAYHVGDNAPEGLTEPGKPGYARGTTALVGPVEGSAGRFQRAFPDAISSGEDDPRTDHDCPVYALHKAHEEGSCEAARCRVCWTRPEIRVNYALH